MLTAPAGLRSASCGLRRRLRAGSGPGCRVRRAEGPGPRGAALEAVEAVFDSAVQLASLVVAVAGWRSTRPRAARVHIERAGVRVCV
ncbi:effector-associated constant component EACC1 [Streptomyces lydicus]|uniref:effector-associated constant component EACC1 n=1 Tax=Streptomyces lydicus TaxID=47763 RepID=UPI0028703F92|nr:hypothetical protein [Streptomyces lydicus]